MAKFLSKIPKTIKGICAASFLINISTVMVFSLFGVYLHKNIGVGLSKIGVLDGAVDSFAFIVKAMSGVASDFFVNRKAFFLIGAVFLFLAKPFEAIATSFWPLFQAKMLERLGNGLQSTPRDALIGDWSPEGTRGTCFGFRQSCTAFGSAIGAIVAVVLMKQSGGDFQFVFWMASIPSFLAIIVIVIFVSDKKNIMPNSEIVQKTTKVKKVRRKITRQDIKNLGPRYWLVIGVAFLYMLAKVSESIVIIHIVSKLDLKNALAPICMLFFGLSAAFIAIPAGVISDKIKSKDSILIFGIVLSILSNILFIYGENLFVMIVGVFFSGAYIGISNSIFPAKIVEIIPADLKGTGIGIFNFVSAGSFLIAGAGVGAIAEFYTMNIALLVSVLIGIVVLLFILVSKRLEAKMIKRQA